MPDLTAREWVIFLPLILSVLWLGIYPRPFLDGMRISVHHLVVQVGGPHG